MFERFTEKSIKVIMLAQEEAKRLQHNWVGTEMILLGLIGEGKGVASQALRESGLDLKTARDDVEKIIGKGDGWKGGDRFRHLPFMDAFTSIPVTPRAQALLKGAWSEAKYMHHDYTGTEHLLLGLIKEAVDSGENDKKLGVAARVLAEKGVDLDKLTEIVERILDEHKSGRR